MPRASPQPEQDTGGGGGLPQSEPWMTPPCAENTNPGAPSVFALQGQTGLVCSTGRPYSSIPLKEPKASISDL